MRSLIESIFKFEKIRKIYKDNYNDPDFNINFWAKALKILNINYEVDGKVNIPSSGPCLIICNHPFGIVDGLIISALVAEVREDYKILINEELAEVNHIKKYLFPLSFKKTKGAKISNINSKNKAIKHLKNNGLLITFPSGEVATSKFIFDKAKEREWKPLVASIYKKSPCEITPVFFSGQNSLFFQFVGFINNNLRRILFVQELLNKKNKTINLTIGKSFKIMEFIKDNNFYLAERMRKKVLSLIN
jgi:putative hemolysin|tara:strand:- start:185 stop:925 length:741 start_codon:yes stop_codon:yes gene_type:complete